jgi:hypothetical protein
MNDGAALQIKQQFEVVYCCTCKMAFAVPEYIRSNWLDSGDSFYCPNGHSQHYSKSNIQKLEKKLASEKKRREWAENDASHAKSQRDRALHCVRAQKAAKTKLKKRIHAGVCPCCNRHFVNLERHMNTKHKDYIEKDK